MKINILRHLPSLVLSAALSSGLTAAAADYVLDDYSANRPLPFDGGAGGSTATIVGGQLQVTSAVNSGFGQYVVSSSLERNGPNLDALLGGDSIDIVLQALGGQPGDFQVRLVANTDAWPTPGNNYRGMAQVYVSANQSGAVTLSFSYAAGSDFAQALTNWSSGAGTYFQFFLDNAGYPALPNPVSFDVSRVSVHEVPAASIVGEYVLDDYEWNRPVPCEGAEGGATATVVNRRLRVVTGTTGGWEQFLRGADLQQGGLPVSALLAGSSLNVHVQSKGSEVTSGFNLQLVANSSAWASGGNYHGLASIWIPAGVDSDQVLTFNYDSNSDFYQVVQNFSLNGGYFYLQFDNGGSPGIATPQTFYLSGVTVGPALGDNYVLDDYNANRPMPFANGAGGSSATIVGNQLDVTSGFTGWFGQYVISSRLPRTGPTMDALLAGQALVITLEAVGGQPQDFQVRLAATSDAWASGGGNYRTFNSVWIGASQTGPVTLTVPYPAGSDLAAAFARWQAGQGSDFEFFLDNAGWPQITSAINFKVTNVAILPAPVLPAAPSLDRFHFSAPDTAWQLDWFAAPALFHLQSAPALAGPWSFPTHSLTTANGTNSALVPLNPSVRTEFFRLFKY